MISPREIRDSAIVLAKSAGGHISETPQALDLKGTFTEESLARWRQVALGLGASEIGTLAALDSFDNPIDLTAVQIDELTDEIRLHLRKTQREGAAYLFFSSSLPVLLEDQLRSEDTLVVFVAEEFAPFKTVSCGFFPWNVANPVLPAKITSSIDPRRYSRDLTGTGAVPRTIGFYLLDQPPAKESDVFRTWANTASPYLALTLVNEVWRNDNKLTVSLNGPRTKKIPLGTAPQDDLKLFSSLQRACEWVYSNPREVEIRHTLLTNELAREWPEASSFFDQFTNRIPQALDSATTAYRAHIRDGSKETLKTLSDLRKTLSDEVSKVSAQTRELIGTLWKDFAIAATALLSRIALVFADKQKAADSVPMKIILVGAAVFCVVNLAVTLRANARFMRIGEKSRSVWKQKLYGFLPDEDLRTLADTPIEESIEAYNQAKRVVVATYSLVTIALLSASAPELTSWLGAQIGSLFTYTWHWLGL